MDDLKVDVKILEKLNAQKLAEDHLRVLLQHDHAHLKETNLNRLDRLTQPHIESFSMFPVTLQDQQSTYRYQVKLFYPLNVPILYLQPIRALELACQPNDQEPHQLHSIEDQHQELHRHQ